MFGIEFTRNQKLALCALAGLSIAGFSYGHIRNSAGSSSGEVVLYEPGEKGAPVLVSGSDPMPSDANVKYAGKVVFQVAGRVNKPGVYELPQGERIINAIAAAGGAKPDADLESMNLAQKIEDGSRIYVPSKQEATAASPGVPITIAGGAAPKMRTFESTDRGSASGKLQAPSQGKVHINSAGSGELQRLPGVGPSTAEKILQYRSQIGRFASLEQLMDVKGIGPKKLEKMRPFVAL